MTTPELKIDPVLPVLAFNFEALRVWATSLTERYKNLVVSEDAIQDVKTDMAELNKAKKLLDDARKETVRKISEPIRIFETQIKEICSIFDSTYTALGNQVKHFENAQREEKRKIVESLIIEGNTNAFDEPSFLPIPIQDKWLNKTTSLKLIREDITTIINQYMEGEQRRKALEQARQDRVGAIENHVKVLNMSRNLNIPISQFINDKSLNMSNPLAGILLNIEDTFKRAVKVQSTAKLNAQPPYGSQVDYNQSCSSQLPKSEPQIPSITQTRTMSVVIEYDLTKEIQIKTYLENLKKLCVNYGARSR